MPLNIPHTFVGGVGNKAYASEVNANFVAVAAKFSEGAGGIGDDDFTADTSRRLKGSKLSQVPGNRVATANIEDEAITDAKLNNDTANPGVDSGRAVSGDHIKALTAAQMARFLPNSPTAGIGSNKLKLTFHAVAFSFATPPWGGVPTATRQAVNPSISFPKATYSLIGLYIYNHPATSLPPMCSSDDSGANWAGFVEVMNTSVGDTCEGSLMYVFAEKA